MILLISPDAGHDGALNVLRHLVGLDFKFALNNGEVFDCTIVRTDDPFVMVRRRVSLDDPEYLPGEYTVEIEKIQEAIYL